MHKKFKKNRYIKMRIKHLKKYKLPIKNAK